MSLTANFKQVMSWVLRGTNPFGTVTTGPASNSFSLSAIPATWDQMFSQEFVIFAKVSFTGNTHTNTTIDNLSSMTGLAVGQRITGSGIPAGTKITVVGVSSITISAAATSSLVGTALIAQNAPIGLAAAVAAGGTLSANTYYYVVTATGVQGTSSAETIISNEASATTAAANLTINLSWTQLAGATGYKVYRGTVAATENVLIGTITDGSTVTFADTGFAGSAASPPASQPDAFVEFDVRAYTNVFGESITLAHFLALQVVPTGTGSTCLFAPGTTNGLTAFLSGTTPVVTIPIPGSFAVSDGPSGTGWVIDATHKTFRITNGGSAALVADVSMIGSTV